MELTIETEGLASKLREMAVGETKSGVHEESMNPGEYVKTTALSPIIGLNNRSPNNEDCMLSWIGQKAEVSQLCANGAEKSTTTPNCVPHFCLMSVDEATAPQCTLMSWLKSGETQTPATDRQTKKQTSVYSEAELFMHHQEPDYAHHKHYLRHNHCAFSHTYSSMFVSSSDEQPQDTAVCTEVPMHNDTEDVQFASEDCSEEPHFKDSYPHYHHYFHHGHQHQHHYPRNHHHHCLDATPLVLAINNDHLTSEDGAHDLFPSAFHENLNITTEDNLIHLNGCNDSNGLDNQNVIHEAWQKLRLRVLNWLDDIPDVVIAGAEDSKTESGWV